ncbi:MAG: transglutaminase domain-containing protein [Clostridiales bacterium]|nr:transglutaminase domain-containing protein [Clostridiales bacterium]
MLTVKSRRKKYALLLTAIMSLNMLLSGCLYNLIPREKKHDYVRIYNAQGLFDLMYEALYNFEENIYVETTSYDEFMGMWTELDDQFALHSAFREKDVTLSRRDLDSSCQIEIHTELNACGKAMQYLYAKNVKKYPTEEAEIVGEELLRIKSEIISDSQTEEEKVKAIHDYLVTHCEYAVDGDVNSYASCDKLFTEGKAQCQGYSEAFAALCLLSGIECRVISGTSTFGFGEGAHAWCQVRIGYIWYHIDVTWDDPIPDVENLVRYDFYLKGDMMMKATHEWCPYYEECFTDYAA